MSGKNFCKIDHKWCRFLKKGCCTKTGTLLSKVKRCPRLSEIETVRLSDMVKSSEFEDVFASLLKFYPEQSSNKDGYKNVFCNIAQKTPSKHKLIDPFICISIINDDEYGEYPSVSGIKLNDSTIYALDLCSWQEWISMFVDKETIDLLNTEDIVAACLYEMTFHGFSEDSPGKFEKELSERLEDCKSL